MSMRGLLVLGDKKSDEDYYEEDLDMLSTLAQEHAIAFENARLYDEAVAKSKELALINKELEAIQSKLLRALEDTEAANKQLQITQASLIVAEKNATMVGMAKAIAHEVHQLSIVSRMAQLYDCAA